MMCAKRRGIIMTQKSIGEVFLLFCFSNLAIRHAADDLQLDVDEIMAEGKKRMSGAEGFEGERAAFCF